ncbi:ribonuclease H-like domain-containing protein [Gymnopilus junonius]|uniref:Ribonuclease H-like domain-containing protein n=1 Tax=Gymnopilus junonius TaxID=109634 RepID=A0A9P5NFZ6_GYMJU|nr:ribonuclease H-like domain-containing protein [Gymnopilus junonius]
MIAHILGKNGSKPCPNTSSEAPKRKLLTKVKASLKQTQLKVFRGINVPFTEEQQKIVSKQFLRATISVNLPFRWVDDPEIIKLFLLFRATVDEAMPNCQQLSGRLLDNADAAVMQRLKQVLRGEYVVLASDGWKDESRDSINGVNISVSGKTYLIDLILAMAHKKDGASMCLAFEGMIDKAEDIYGVKVVAFCCDNDGGSQRGRKDLVIKRPWLFGPPCCAHQAEISIPPGKVLAYLVANLTHWTTHFVAFDRLCDLKDALRRAVISCRDDIISAQKKQKLEDEAMNQCDLIDDGGFWCRLKAVVDDLEPICLGINLNQMDALHPDQALLTFAGIFLYFQKHSNPSIAAGMTKRVKKCWKALDQPMFILALVLNPFEGVSCFGNKAAVSPFTLNTVLLQIYHCVHSRPPKKTQVLKEKEVSESFLSYLSSKGPFEDWEKNKKGFQSVHGNDPIAIWKAFLSMPSIYELADLALLLLGMSVNQAGLECNFSDLKIKKTHLRNRLKLPRLEKMAKVGADIRALHKEAGFIEECTKRKNHDDAKVAKLLVVPRYADLVEEEANLSNEKEEGISKAQSGLVKSREGWQKEMAKWVQTEWEHSDDSDDDDDKLGNTMYGRQQSKWLPRSLELLFGGRKETDIDEQLRRGLRRQAYSEEARLMELLANEEEDEERILDDGELEGSGDDFEGWS